MNIQKSCMLLLRDAYIREERERERKSGRSTGWRVGRRAMIIDKGRVFPILRLVLHDGIIRLNSTDR